MSTISVIVPIYNVEAYLRQCLDSIVGQTLRDLEILLVDDGSTDGSDAICAEYAAKDGRVKVFHQANGGAAAARNHALEHASGTWIAFVDSDDWLEPDYFEKMMAALGDERPDVLFAGGYIAYYGQTEIVQTVSEPFDLTDPEELRMLAIKVVARKQPVRGIVASRQIVVPWDRLYNREFLKENGITFCGRIRGDGEDTLFNWSAISRAHRVMGCTIIGYYHRRRTTSINNRYFPNKFDDVSVVTEMVSEDISRGENAKRFPSEIIHVLALHAVGASLQNDVLHPDNPHSRSERKKEFERIKNTPIVRAAVKSKSNYYLMIHELALKYLLRLPWFWPVELSWGMYMKHKRKSYEYAAKDPVCNGG